MGLFSSVVNFCDVLGKEDFIGTIQTKDLESWAYLYWLTPDGHLYRVIVPERGSGAVSRGRVTPYRKSGIVTFTAYSRGKLSSVSVHFKTGELTGIVWRGEGVDSISPFA